MIFKNSQEDIVIRIPDRVKTVSLKISGGADSAIVGYMLCKYITKERPDIKIVPVTTIHPGKPFQEIYSKRVLEFLKNKFGNVFEEHCVNTANNGDDYSSAQDRLFEQPGTKTVQRNFSGITANPPKEVYKQWLPHAGPADNRDGKNFPQREKDSYRHLVNIDKKGVAELYVTLGVMETLFPITRSCEALANSPEYNIDKNCEQCWWCKERYWGFGRYE